MEACSYIGIWFVSPKVSGDVRLWRANVRRDDLRDLTTTPHAAEAARWWDAYEDAREQRDLEEKGIPLPAIRKRNFDADTWRMVSCCTGREAGGMGPGEGASGSQHMCWWMTDCGEGFSTGCGECVAVRGMWQGHHWAPLNVYC